MNAWELPRTCTHVPLNLRLRKATALFLAQALVWTAVEARASAGFQGLISPGVCVCNHSPLRHPPSPRECASA